MKINLVVLNEREDGVVIKPFEAGSRPNNFVGVAPQGFESGDEKYLIFDKENRRFSVDHNKRAAALKQDRNNLLAKKEKDDWNNSSILGRLKSKMFQA